MEPGTARLSSRSGGAGNAPVVRKGADQNPHQRGGDTVLQMAHRHDRLCGGGGGAVGPPEDDDEEGHEISHGETSTTQVSFNLCNAILGAHRPAELSLKAFHLRSCRTHPPSVVRPRGSVHGQGWAWIRETRTPSPQQRRQHSLLPAKAHTGPVGGVTVVDMPSHSYTHACARGVCV